MPHLPANVAESNLSRLLQKSGLPRLHQGKVRDMFRLNRRTLLLVPSNRLSIFDFVLPALIDQKGEILTAMTAFWLYGPLKEFRHHCLAFGRQIDLHLPPHLRNNPTLQRVAMVVQDLQMTEYEWAARNYLTGSGLKDYQATGQICGHSLPSGLHDGSKLEPPLFTPATKSQEGHDQNIDYRRVEEAYGRKSIDHCMAIFKAMSDHAASVGFLMADNKMEFGKSSEEPSPDLILGDEVGTPDCSRFWKISDWEISVLQKKAPPSYDKQIARQWGETIQFEGIPLKKLDPTNPKHLEFVSQLQIPSEVLIETAAAYHEIFESISGYPLTEYQRAHMLISA